MEKECFEDEEVAKLLNEHFVSIKVDREERPDIDNIYMEVCMGLTGHGGWPLTIFMTPDKKPFFAGTYFPKYSQNQMIGLMDLLEVIISKWQDNKSDLLNSADDITRIIRNYLENSEHDELIENIIDKAYEQLKNNFDDIYGGFGKSPKFPSPHNLLFLLRYGIYRNNSYAIKMVEKTLIQMYKGGIFDHIGYGFSRYAVDDKWLIPHFEKMLYDNSLLIIAYSEAYQLTHKEIYKEIAEKIISFVLNEMTTNEGAFYSAIDADSEGEEGKFYTWTIEEIKSILSLEEARFLIKHFNMTEKGNFAGKNILNLIHKDDVDVDNEKWENIRYKLYNHRDRRVHPHIDDKILTSNNALMITSLAIAGRIFDNQTYIEKAEKALEFINKNLITNEKRLLSRYRDGEAKYLGYLEDYAFLVFSLIELFLSTGKSCYLTQALDYNNRMLDLFLDNEKGGFYQTGKDSEELIMKIKPLLDGAIPSGNSVITMNFIRLSEITDDIGLSELAKKQFEYFASKIKESPQAYIYMLTAYMFYIASKRKIVLVTGKNNIDINTL
ncbi:MAG TPA: thioredoxin domain-containing protein [Haloplasmataceae bacterium]